MTLAIALASCVGEAALIYIMLILLRLSRKLGDVIKMKPYYRGYYVAIGFLSIALIVRFVQATLVASPADMWPAWVNSTWFSLVLHHAMLAMGLTVPLPIMWKYWGWLFRE